MWQILGNLFICSLLLLKGRHSRKSAAPSLPSNPNQNESEMTGETLPLGKANEQPPTHSPTPNRRTAQIRSIEWSPCPKKPKSNSRNSHSFPEQWQARRCWEWSQGWRRSILGGRRRLRVQLERRRRWAVRAVVRVLRFPWAVHKFPLVAVPA